MSFRVRSSKFRHVFGSVYKKESCYEGIKITKNAHDNNFCEVNPKFLSVVTESAGGGSFLVLPLEKVGRVDANCPKVCGHTGPILDVKWNPFSDQVIASASDDATVKIWQIPENGLDTTLTDWMVDLHGHTRRVGYLDWHPTAENVLLSAGYDFNCILWNVETAEPVNILSLHPDNIFSIGWNYDGSMFATTCKDKNLRVIDPRLGNIVSECAGHQGSKASKVKFLGNRNKLFSVGFSRLSDRQYALWDMRNMSKPMRMESIDTSSGIMWPFCDYDTNVVFVAGKGDGNIRYFELVGDAPYMHYLSQYQSGSPQRGLGVMPKRGLDTSRCEIMRFYKLHSVKALVEPISMIVPRKSEMFQDDIYPPTSSLLPSLSADEWIAGSNRDPILMSLKDGQIIASTRSSTGKALQRKKPVRPSYNEGTQCQTNSLGGGNLIQRKITVLRGNQVRGSGDRLHGNSGYLHGNNSNRLHSNTARGSLHGNNGNRVHSNSARGNLHGNNGNRLHRESARSNPHGNNGNRFQNNNARGYLHGNIGERLLSNSSRTSVHSNTASVKLDAPCTKTGSSGGITVSVTSKTQPVKSSRDVRRNTMTTGCTQKSPKGVVTKATMLRLPPQVSSTPKFKDGGIVPTPTITTYKAIKRGQSVTEAPSVKRSSQMTKAMSMDQPDQIPASVKNIAKLSTVGESGDTGQGIDVINKIGMFEKKTQHNSPPERQWSSGQQKEGSPDKQWTTGYQSTVKTEVTTPTQSPTEESSPFTIHQPSPSSNHNSARGGTSRQQGVTIAQHSPIFERPPSQRKISPQQEQPSNSSLFSVRGDSMTTELFSDDSDTLSPDNGLATSQSQLAAKKRSRRTHSYRRRRENRILNESSDQDMFSTPPTSPAIKTQAWNENPVFGTDNAVDISALDDALNDFEILTKSFHPSTHQAGVSPETTVQSNHVAQSKPTVSNALSKSEKQLDSSRSALLMEEIVASKSMTNIGSVLELQREKPSSDSPQLLSSKLSQSAHTIQSFGATSELTSPEPSGNSESTEMIDFINTDAPDNTLIKPSKLRASMKSKRRLTQEILQPGAQQRRSSFDSSPSPGPRQGSHSPSPGPPLKAKSQTQLQRAGSPENKLNGLHRAGSLREKVAKDAEQTEFSLRRAQSLRDRSRSNTKQKQMTIVERNSGTKPSQELNNNNNKTYDMSGKISPRTVSRPLQLALEMGTSKTSTQSIGERSKNFEATSPVIHQEKAAQRQDSFKSSTKVQLNSPVHNAPQSPVHMYPSRSTRVQAHSPTHLSQPVQTGNLQFTTGTTQDRTSPDKFLFSPTDGSRSSPLLVNSLQGSFPGQLQNGPGDTDNKIHVKKVWSPRNPSQSEPVLENGETHGLPTTDPELRKAYFRQLEEIQSLKQQITYKDKRIRQLEDELRLLRLPSSPELGESVC